jgi:hypothetical protein
MAIPYAVLSRARAKGSGRRSTSWTLLMSAAIAISQGHGSFIRQTAGRSLVVYEVDMEPDSAIPDFMIRRAQSFAAPRVFAAVRERVRQCAAPLGCGQE